MALRASSLQDAHQADPCDMSWPGGTSSEVVSFPSAKYRHQASLGSLRPCLAPLLAISDSNDPEPSAELDSPGPQEAQAQSSTRDQQSRLSKVTGGNRTSMNFSLPVSQMQSSAGSLQGGGLPGDTLSHVQLSRSA